MTPEGVFVCASYDDRRVCPAQVTALGECKDLVSQMSVKSNAATSAREASRVKPCMGSRVGRVA